MTLSLTKLLIPTYKQNLKSLLAWLDKDGVTDETLSHQLAPDMFPLSTQIRFICLQAQEAVHRIQARENSEYLAALGQEGRDFFDQGRGVLDTIDDDHSSGSGSSCNEPKKDTLLNAKTRIQEALVFLESLEPDALDQGGLSAERILTLELPNTEMIFDMTGEQYARDWALPQFYFHVVVAYSILRNAGVELGKADFVPHMFAYLRAPPPAPAAVVAAATDPDAVTTEE